MTTREEITPATNLALQEAADRYFEAVVPYDQQEATGFIVAYIGWLPIEARMFIVPDTKADSLAINIRGSDEGFINRLINVDLDVPERGLAAHVVPDFFKSEGEHDSVKGRYMRKVLRLLSEPEGQELTMDLYSIIEKAPANRRKTKVHQL